MAIHSLAHLIFLLFTLLTSTIAYTKLSDESLKAIPDPGDTFNIKTGSILSPILQVRVPGTPGAEKVRQHFYSFFSKELPLWKVTLQNSTQSTPLGGAPITFVNVIATRDPPWARVGEVGRLALVAHYDSKLTPEGFIGATDSAAPVAMILHAAKALDKAMTRKWDDMKAKGQTGGLEAEKGVQLILLDGEEAFVNWTDDDSLYGARALAHAWDSSTNPAMSTHRTTLTEISLFLLLDLLGAKNPRMPSYFKTTHWAYKNMATLETRLRSLQSFKSSPNHPSKAPKSTNPKGKGTTRPTREPVWLNEANKNPNLGQFLGGMVQDDHIPFMARGVEVLHFIPSPFPNVWHTANDDGAHLDIPTCEDWAKLVTAFTAEWMDLEGFMRVEGKPAAPAAEMEKSKRDGVELDRRKEEGIISKTEL
ncbi:peptidase M28 [Tothia fuscella]|uniref:Peptide hydrolase n=1 Tax=Tothia fuscella TaxID=1048955 RepID=A0A9P4P570_9PEZI|nr:peptidase M28 [Tothia fuscella]